MNNINLYCFLLYFLIKYMKKLYEVINKMGKMIIEDNILVKHINNSNETKYVIPNGVIEIKDNVFNDGNLESIIISDSVVKIGEYVFSECTNLKEIIMSNNIKEIGDYTFYSCESLGEIALPEGITKISAGMFSECSNLEKVILKGNVTEIEEYAFSDCKNLVDITLPESVNTIEKYAFEGCMSLPGIIIPNGVNKISECAFCECYSLKNVVLPDTITEIEDWAFARCASLKNIVIPRNVEKIGNNAFYWCDSLKSITLPESIIGIGNNAFDENHIQNINVFSYRVFSLLDKKLKLIAISSIIKNCYTNTFNYSDEDMELFKKYIRENKMDILLSIKSNINLIRIIIYFMIYNIDKIFTHQEISNLLDDINDIEIRAMLLEYSKKINNEDINPLGKFDDNTKGNEKKLKK